MSDFWNGSLCLSLVLLSVSFGCQVESEKRSSLVTEHKLPHEQENAVPIEEQKIQETSEKTLLNKKIILSEIRNETFDQQGLPDIHEKNQYEIATAIAEKILPHKDDEEKISEDNKNQNISDDEENHDLKIVRSENCFSEHYDDPVQRDNIKHICGKIIYLKGYAKDSMKKFEHRGTRLYVRNTDSYVSVQPKIEIISGLAGSGISMRLADKPDYYLTYLNGLIELTQPDSRDWSLKSATWIPSFNGSRDTENGFHKFLTIESLLHPGEFLSSGSPVSIKARSNDMKMMTWEIDIIEKKNENCTTSKTYIDSATELMTTGISDTDSLNFTMEDFLTAWASCYETTNTPLLQSVKNFISAFDSHHEALFQSGKVAIVPDSMSILQRIQYEVQYWIFNKFFTRDHLEEVNGIRYRAADFFPGAVTTKARHFATVNINGNYQTPKGYTLNGQHKVIRMTGYYAAPGEQVTVSIANKYVRSGLKVMIGLHQDDYETLYKNFNRFPQVGKTFPLWTSKTIAANPFGGGIYIVLPDGSHMGEIEIKLENVVRSPFFSTLNNKRSTEEWKYDRDSSGVQWFDWESEGFMATLPVSMAKSIDDPTDILRTWTKIFEAYNYLGGRELPLFRAEYMSVDRLNPTPGSRLSAQYPLFAPYNLTPVVPKDTWWSPIRAIEQKDIDWVVLHEYGHLEHVPGLTEEEESEVHIPSVYVHENIFGHNLDEAMKKSVFQKLSLNEAAIDWMLTENFIKGIRARRDSYSHQLIYQSRGHAKWIDIARIYGWELIRSANKEFLKNTRETGIIKNIIGDDEYIRTMSKISNKNLAPLFEFWGVIPSDSLVEELSVLPKSWEAGVQILNYLQTVPSNYNGFLIYFDTMSKRITPPNGSPRYDDLKNFDFTQTYSGNLEKRIAQIIDKYYGNSLHHFTNRKLTLKSVSEESFAELSNNLTVKMVSDNKQILNNFEIVKGLSGVGISFRVLNHENSYLCFQNDDLGRIYIRTDLNATIQEQPVDMGCSWIPKFGGKNPETQTQESIYFMFSPFSDDAKYIQPTDDGHLKVDTINNTDKNKMKASWQLIFSQE
ncbi:MAG: hypothetical protein H6618_07200 [Deltaproteobacteria bacterium]|nr:hypothetical protein [Deltaproteobacteria bacterium]